MEAITLLTGIKIVVDVFEGNWTGFATGILIPPPVSDLYTIGDSVYYLFDVNGNRIGTKDIIGIRKIPFSQITLTNESQVRIGLQTTKNNIGLSSYDDNIGLK